MLVIAKLRVHFRVTSSVLLECLVDRYPMFDKDSSDLSCWCVVPQSEQHQEVVYGKIGWGEGVVQGVL